MSDLTHTIEFDTRYEWWSVYEFGTYERSSVLAGQTRKRFVTRFDTEAEAQAAYPSASVGYRSAHNTYNHLPDEPDDGYFDEDDY
jgi:hypothetical protein